MQNIVKHLTKITNSKETKSRVSLQTAKFTSGFVTVTDGHRLIRYNTDIITPEIHVDLNTLKAVPDISYPMTEGIIDFDTSVSISLNGLKPKMPLLKALKSEEYLDIIIQGLSVEIATKSTQTIHEFKLDEPTQIPTTIIHIRPSYLIDAFECLLEFSEQSFELGVNDTHPATHPVVFNQQDLISYVIMPIKLR